MGIKSHYLEDSNGNKFYPYAHANATFDSNGVKVGTRLDEIEQNINSATTDIDTHIENNDVHITSDEREKLSRINDGAEVNVQSNWNETNETSDAFIKNKPTSLPANGGNADTVGGHTVESDVPSEAKFTDTLYDDTDLSNRIKTIEDDYINSSELESHTNDTVIHITSTERKNWNDTNDKKHTHDNESVLDNTTASFTTEEKNKLAGIASGANAYTLPSAGSSLGGVKTGGDVTISSGVITVNDDSHAHVISNIDGLQDSLDEKVPMTRTVNGKALSSDIILSSSDVGADASGSANTALANAKSYTNSAITTETNRAKSVEDTKVDSVKIGTTEYKSGTVVTLPVYTIDEADTTFGADISLSIDTSTYKMTLVLKDNTGKTLSTQSIDFPIESMVVNASYASGTLTLTLQNGNKLNVDISSIISGLVPDTRTIAGVDLKDNITTSELRTALNVADGANKYIHPSYTAKSSGLYKITVDSTGHISEATAVAKSDITALGIPSSDTNTHYASKNIVAGSSTATSNTTSALSNGSVYLISVENGAVTSSHKITGSGATTVTTDASGNIVISSTDTNVNTNTTYTLTKSGSTITLTGSDGSTTSVTDSNTTYSTGTTSTSGLTKLYTGTGSNTDGTMTQKAITTALSSVIDGADFDFGDLS